MQTLSGEPQWRVTPVLYLPAFHPDWTKNCLWGALHGCYNRSHTVLLQAYSSKTCMLSVDIYIESHYLPVLPLIDGHTQLHALIAKV
jgi:hypothetical protein